MGPLADPGFEQLVDLEHHIDCLFLRVLAPVARFHRLEHGHAEPPAILPLDAHSTPEARSGLSQPRLERAIGVIYRPATELASHYFEAVLPRQFDEYVWVDRSSAVKPFDVKTLDGVPDTYPFGL